MDDSFSRIRVARSSPARLPPREEVVGLVSGQIGSLLPDAIVVGAGVSVPLGRPIDVLAADSRGSPIVVDVFGGRDPSWVAEALHHLKWVEDNRAVLSETYSRIQRQSGGSARLAAILPGITQPARSAMAFLKDVPIEFFIARCVDVGRERMLILDPIVFTPPALKDENTAKAGTRFQSLIHSPNVKQEAFVPIELTEAEVKDFLDNGGLHLSVSSS